MKSVRLLPLLWLPLCCLPIGMPGQSVLILEECGVSYIDPQDELGHTQPSQDTLLYTTYFNEDTLLRSYYIDINAFGGQQVDRSRVFALMPDGSRKELGRISFGNCVDCVDGFALADNDSLLVQGVSDVNTMNLWLQSQGQPPYALPANLQTLNGVGRLSGQLPFCAEGMQVEFVVFSNPNSTSTEFSTHIHCPEAVRSCVIRKEVAVDCQQDSISLQAILPEGCFSGPVQVEWSNSNGWSTNTTTAQLALSGNEGMYYLRVEDDCCLYVDSILVENPDFAQAGADQLICQGAVANLQGGGGASHFWESPNGNTTDGALLSIPDAQAADSGPYILHAFNEEGCEDTDTLLLTVNVPPVPQILFTEVCLGDTLLLSLSNDSLFNQVTWSGAGGNNIPNGMLYNFQPDDIGIYTFTAADSLGCQIIETFDVFGFTPSDIESVIEESCDSTRIYLFPDTYQYVWETNQTGPTFATASGGSFRVSITDGQGCLIARAYDLPTPDGPDVEIEVEQPVCPNDYGVIRFIPSIPDQPLIYSIDGGDTYALSPRFGKLMPGIYPLAIQDGLGCIREQTVTLLSPDTLAVNLDIAYLEVRPNTPVSLSAQVIGDVLQYQWLPREIDTEGPVTSFLARQDMDVRIIVEDARGCKASDGFQLTIVLGDIYAPNAFSPDEDGRNDRFTFYSDNGSGEIIESLRVYDRWGALIYKGEELYLNDESTGWDGYFGEKRMNPGVYTYHGIVRFGNGARKSFKGDVSLVR
ncbi:MAG: gliding motility-associated C-terminal domain-containing protein [Lewinellaceae bacterium]|nr:gliding motility-associated C-terminal domain-containing protein [Phaeodactylibacter sp.]MCB9348108.1 gliding motility-associated C-terminal domain-containing protein [Lewinellaceae bacterium]